MTSDVLKGLAEEKVVFAGHSLQASLQFPLKGIVRLIDKTGNTLGIIFSKDALDEFSEDIDSTGPAFLSSLKLSRKSGRVSSKEVKRKLGLK